MDKNIKYAGYNVIVRDTNYNVDVKVPSVIFCIIIEKS